MSKTLYHQDAHSDGCLLEKLPNKCKVFHFSVLKLHVHGLLQLVIFCLSFRSATCFISLYYILYISCT